MEIPRSMLDAFIILYENTYGERLTVSEATKQATLLINYVRLCKMPSAKTRIDDTLKGSNESRT